MMGRSERLHDYLAESKPLVDTASAELTVAPVAGAEPVVVGLTDRRLIALSEANEFTSIPYDQVALIRSTSTEEVDHRGNDYRVLLAGVVLLAGLGLVAVSFHRVHPLALLSFLLACGGLVGLYYGQQGKTAALTDHLDALGGWDITPPLKRDRLLASGGGLTVLGLAGTILLTSSLVELVVTLGVVTAVGGGILVAAYGWHHRDELEGIEFVRTARTEIRLETSFGSTVSLVADSAEELDRTLSRAVYGRDADKPLGRQYPELTQDD